MKVRLVGFTFEIDQNKGALGLDAFARFVGVRAAELEGDGESKRLLFMNADHDVDYFVGLVVTVKDHRAYCELVKDGAEMRLKVTEVAEGSQLMEFNFFVLHKTTFNGLYQYYHQSCSANAFATICGSQFREYRNDLIDTELATIPTQKRTTQAEAKVRTKYTGLLKSAVIVRKEALESMIKELQRVKSFQYAVATPIVEEHSFKPLARWIKKKVHRISFATGAPVTSIAKAIGNTVSELGIVTGRVEGIDEADVERVLKIVNNPDTFGEYSYDSIASQINDLNLAEFHESWMIQELLSKARANKHILEVVMKK